jgi:hypothetical protein
MALTRPRPRAGQINFDVTNITDPLIRLNSGETGSAKTMRELVIHMMQLGMLLSHPNLMTVGC